MKSHAELVVLAKEARQYAYAPYSRFLVGAALETRDGRTFTGVNVENAAYGLAFCAERSAIVAAVSAGALEFSAIAIVTSSAPPAPPCGSCLQALAEFALDLPIVLANLQGQSETTSLAALLPRAFRAQALAPALAKPEE